MELAWNRNTEANFKEYRVMRAEEGGPFVEIAHGLDAPVYSDHAVQSGKHYRYEVLAVARNDCQRSLPPRCGRLLHRLKIIRYSLNRNIFLGPPIPPGCSPRRLRSAFPPARARRHLVRRPKCLRRPQLCRHAKEMGVDVPAEPTIFLKPPSSLIASGDAIVYPRLTQRLDYEGEIGVVMGRRARNVKSADAFAYILGYTPVNDVTARDLQRKDGQWTRGKGFDTFCPVGRISFHAMK